MSRRQLPALPPVAAAPSPVNLLAGFDDWMEEREPGYKARRVAEKAERERLRLERRAAILARYGSEEAALAPCRFELLLRKALKPWMTMCEPPWQRWTSRIAGYDGWGPRIPDDFRQAVANAYPLPATFAQALVEQTYWLTRRAEMEDVRGDFGDDGLDLVASLRFSIVRDLAEHELPTETLHELHQRFGMMQASEVDEPAMRAALYRDLGTILQRQIEGDAA